MSSVIETLKQSFQNESRNVFLLNESQEVVWKNDAKLLDGVPPSYIDNILKEFFINGAEDLKFIHDNFVYLCNVVRIPDGSENIYVFQFSKKAYDKNNNLLPAIIENICSSPVYLDSESYTSEATSIITNMFQSILFKCEQSEHYEIIKYVNQGMKGVRMINRFNLLLKELFYCYSNNCTSSNNNVVSLSETCESVINGCDDVLRESKLEFPCNIEDNIFVDIPSTHLKLFLILIILRLYRQNVNNKQFSVSLTKNNDYAIFLAKSSYESHDNKNNNNIDLLEELEKYVIEGFCKKFNITLMDFKDESGCPNISLKIPVYKNTRKVSFKSSKRMYGSSDNTRLHRILMCNIITADTLRI